MIGRIRAALGEHPRHVVLAALVAGLLAGVWLPFAVPVAAAVAALAAGRRATAALAAVAVIAGAGLGDARRDAVDGGVLPVAEGAPLRTEVVLLEPLRARGSGERTARVELAAPGPSRGEALLLRVPAYATVAAGDGGRPPDVGELLRIEGRLGPLDDFEDLQRRRGALAAIDARTVAATGRTRGGLAGTLDGVRRRAERALSAGVEADRAAVVHGMVLGRDERVTPSAREAWQDSGLAHLLAASGGNVMLLATLVLALGAVGGVPLRWRLGVALVLVALYVPVAGAGPSIQRAGVMGAAGLLAALAGRPSSRWYALLLAAAVTLLLNPYAAAEPGWQLSFAAVVGLLAAGGSLRDTLRRRAVPSAVAEVTALTVVATVATAPLMALHFERVSLVSLPANLVAAAAVAPVMWLGTVVALLGQAGVVTPLAQVAGALAGFVDAVAHRAAGLPWATVEASTGLAAGAAATFAVALAWVVRREAAGPVSRPTGGGRRPARRPPAAASLAAGALAGLALLVLLLPGAGPPPLAPGETRVSFLDVGQGDATLLRRGDAAVLVDTGPPGGPVVDEVRRAGVGRLDGLLVTHAQSDHEGEALGVIRRLRPRLIVNGGAGWDSPVQVALPAAARAVGARVVTVAAGDAVRFGDLELRVLWPPRSLAVAPPAGDPNDRALVTHARSGEFDVLLPADAESDVTAGVRLPRVEALKVAHHGSADDALPAMLAQTRPALAAIEVGRGNPYGHPEPSTLAALDAAVGRVHRTDRDGTIHLTAGRDGRMQVQTTGTLR